MAIDPTKPLRYPSVTPYICVDGADAALDFYTAVLGAEQRLMLRTPDGRVAHGELAIGDGVIMISDPFPDSRAVPPDANAAGFPVHVSIYVDDADAVYDTALEHGATSLSEPSDQFYGDRTAGFVDPFGHRWNVQQRIEEVSPDEIAARMSKMSG